MLGRMFTRRSISAGLAATIGSSSLAARRAAKPWPDGARAAVSLTYDDGLDSQLDNAAGALDGAGLKATFFLTRVNMEARADDWVRLAGRGHEIGNHTVTHPCGLGPYTAESFARREILPMQAYLDARFGANPKRLYAYPCSITDLGAGGPNQQLSRYEGLLKTIGFRAARSCDEDTPNNPAHVHAQRYMLRASATTYDKDDPGLAMDYVRGAMKRGEWAILVFHDVVKGRRAPGETSTATHETILRWLKSQPVWCAPMGAVLDRIDGAATTRSG